MIEASRAPEPRNVASLLGHAQVEMAIACLSSLLRCSADPLRLVLHEDGTLEARDRERLLSSLPGSRLVPAPEADARVAECLRRHPASLAFRRDNPLARKLLDIPLLCEDESLAYCDSDVLFFRPFTDLFRFAPDDTDAIFQCDLQDAYSVRSWQLLLEPRLRLPAHVNTGILHTRRKVYDPDFLEWFLSKPQFRRTPPWVEQTGWALLAGRGRCRLYDPAQIALAGPGGVTGDPVAVHFVSPLRQHLEAALRSARDRSLEPPVRAKTVATTDASALRLARTELARRWHR